MWSSYSVKLLFYLWQLLGISFLALVAFLRYDRRAGRCLGAGQVIVFWGLPAVELHFDESDDSDGSDGLDDFC